MRKKVDERIRTLIENGVKLRHRSMFVIIGDKSRDQVLESFLLGHLSPWENVLLDTKSSTFFFSLTDSEPPSYVVKGSY